MRECEAWFKSMHSIQQHKLSCILYFIKEDKVPNFINDKVKREFAVLVKLLSERKIVTYKKEAKGTVIDVTRIGQKLLDKFMIDSKGKDPVSFFEEGGFNL